MRVAFEELAGTLAAILAGRRMDSDRGELCARLFAETDCAGVYTHGVNRFPRFVRMIDAGGSMFTRRRLFRRKWDHWNGRTGVRDRAI
jgi:LDH2 family malate/lactate/ureidoglycolate dehydrogenase